jgi:hypothetical protein
MPQSERQASGFVSRFCQQRCHNHATESTGAAGPSGPAAPLPGDDIGKATPVPIPNTAVKLSEPMIVPTSAKVGLAGLTQ